ncbi:uncharacterized protein LOC141570203 [Rhinolophus sinicus]|uniref:uncharacterized protein LOC141570203 n=1 Tax=Rhinolophus sinicus TaxID=89399 RepID=UPI003D78EDF4
MKVSLSGHLAGGCPNLRPMRAAFCGSGAERDLHPEGTEAPPPPTAVNAQSWATAHVRWESVGATALGREGASTTQSPSKGVTGAFGTQGTGSLGRRKVPENALLAPALRPAPPRIQRRAGARASPGQFRAAALGRIPAPPAACLCPPSAFVHEGCTKWPPQPSAILCRRRAGAVGEGGRRGPLRPPARRGLAGAQRRPARARPWHQPTSWQGGRPLAQPRPAPAPGGRGRCRPEPRGAVIKAMLLGSLGPARTVLEKTLARPGVGCWTPCTGPGRSRAAPGTRQQPPPSTRPLSCPGPARGAPGSWCGRGYHVSSGSRGRGLPGGGGLPRGQLRSCSCSASGAASAARVGLVERQWPC